MPKDIFTVGPVLSFRGAGEDGAWRVSALVGVAAGTAPPALRIEDRQVAAPVGLATHGGQTFLRYDLSCDQHDGERRVTYGVAPDGPGWQFTVPGRGYAPRMAYVSCNGFSDPSAMRKLSRPENAVWGDLLANHDRGFRPAGYKLDREQLWHEERIHDEGVQRFHLLLMGGDQIYFDSIWEELQPLKRWVSLSRDEQLGFRVTRTLERQIEDYYLTLYARRWLPDSRARWGKGATNGDAADAMASIPTIMMWDDHDIFDGWGSYSPMMQQSELFRTLFRHARRAFWVFQMQHRLDDLPALAPLARADVSQDAPQYAPIAWGEVGRADPLFLPLLDNQPGFTLTHHVGPVSLFVADLRTERARSQVLGPRTWSALQGWLDTVRDGKPAHPGSKCQHLIFLSSVPVAHPKLSLAEGLLDSFGRDDVQDSNADDLKDHWSHDDHEGERKRLLESLLQIADRRRLRVSIVSGDVHVAAWGTAYRRDVPPTANWAQIQQFTSSAVVHPSLMGVLERLFVTLMNNAAARPQSIDIQLTAEMMLFPGHNRYVMPARNWLALELDRGEGNPNGCKLWATWRCETETGFSNHLQAVQPAAQASAGQPQ